MAKIDGLEIVMTKQIKKMIDKELKKRFEELKPELATRYEELLFENRNLTARIAELEAESERFTAHDATERQDDKLPEREVCEACGGDGTLLLVDNYKGQATATVDCPYCNGTGRVNKECEE